MKKWILLLLVLVAVVAAIGASMDTLLEKGVEEGGSLAFGTETRLEDADLDLLGGSLAFKGLSVRNPPGFSQDDALRVGRFEVETRLASLLSDVIEVDHIVLDGPEITIEVGKDGTNLGKLLEHLDRAAGGAGGEERPAGEEEPATEETGGGKKLRVGLVRVENAKVRVKQSLLGESETTIELPPLELVGLGAPKGAGEATGPEPLTLPALLERILGAITAAAAGEGALPGDLRKLLEGELDLAGLEDVKAEIESVLDRAGEQAEEAVEELKEKGKGALEELQKKLGEGAGGDLGKGLDGLLGGKKDKKKDDG